MSDLSRFKVAVVGFIVAFWPLKNFGAIELSLECLNPGETPSFGYPYDSTVVVSTDGAERYVSFSMLWSPSGVSSLREFGLEFKQIEYNYDNAASLGKGPAYVLGPKNIIYCTLPGCYVDSDFGSATNSYGEYAEPQVAIGIEPGYGSQIVPDNFYLARLSAYPGRGSSALMKVHYYTTKRIAPIGVSGIFHCSDIPFAEIMSFPQFLYAPACLRQIGEQVGSC